MTKWLVADFTPCKLTLGVNVSLLVYRLMYFYDAFSFALKRFADYARKKEGFIARASGSVPRYTAVYPLAHLPDKNIAKRQVRRFQVETWPCSIARFFNIVLNNSEAPRTRPVLFAFHVPLLEKTEHK